jgi:hypothetical protein
MFDFVDKAFHRMPFFVPMSIVFSLLLTVGCRWNHRLGLFVGDQLQNLVTIIGFVSYQTFKVVSVYQILGLRTVMSLTTSQDKTQWVAQSIDNYMDFGREAAAAASQCLLVLTAFFFEAPTAQGWARMMVLSGIRFSISGSSAK